MDRKKIKIAITGHTSGIGLSLFTRFTELGNDVYGFSRSNGYDIGSNDVCDRLIDRIVDCDVFVNNAYHSVGQNRLLARMLTKWDIPQKSIINISSNIVSVPYVYFDQHPLVQEYRSNKLVSNDIINSYTGSVNILNVLPEGVNTNFYLGKLNPAFLANGMHPDYVADIVIDKFNKHEFETVIIKNPGLPK